MALTDSTKIIENGIVATGDTHNRIGPFALLIRNDRIIEVAPRSEPLKNLYPAAEVIDAKGKMLLPGFVDAHYHAESFLLRHITGTTPMARWGKDRRIASSVAFLDREASREDLDSLYRLAYFNALKAGITCLADYGLPNIDLSLVAAFEAMKRADLKGFIGLHNGDQIEKSRTLQSTSIKFALVIPNEEDLTTYSLQSTLRSAEDLRVPLMIQLGETRRALETLKKNFKRTTTQLLNEFHLFDLRIQLSHLSFLEGNDADILAASKIPVIVSPHSAVLKEVDIPPLSEFFAHGIPIALGSDWGVPNPFQNLRSLAAIVRAQNKPIPSPFEMLSMCTRNAARALGLQDEIGTIEPGKKADITFVEMPDARRGFAAGGGNHPNLLGSVLLESSTRDVSDVMINGNFFVRSGNVLTYSEEDLFLEATKLIAKLNDYSSRLEVVKVADPQSQGTPILRLEPAISDDEEEDGQQEGFRIIKKGIDVSEKQKKIIPLHTEPPKNVELPKTVKKVFGEDDI